MVAREEAAAALRDYLHAYLGPKGTKVASKLIAAYVAACVSEDRLAQAKKRNPLHGLAESLDRLNRVGR